MTGRELDAIRKRDARSGTLTRGLAGPGQAPQRDRRALLAALDELRRAAWDVQGTVQALRPYPERYLVSGTALNRLRNILGEPPFPALPESFYEDAEKYAAMPNPYLSWRRPSKAGEL